MSTYECYDETSAHYDTTRLPVGAGIIAGALALCGTPLARIRLLDAGCGSGNYAEALIDAVGHIDAVDRSQGMLAVAREKLMAYEQARRIVFHQATIDALPFDDGRFDGAMLNQVLHHLESGTDQHYPGHRRALAETFRVLGPGGVAVINVCSHEQVRRGYWYYDLIPGAMEAALKRCIPLDLLAKMLDECGFVPEDRIVPFDSVMQGDAYFDGGGPLRADWRGGDSIWALASEDELAGAISRVRDLMAAGGLAAYVETHDAARPDVGQFTFVVARKPKRNPGPATSPTATS